MKIYFCDLCNESIPQEDLEKSRVTSVRGKLICAKCVAPVAPGAAAGGNAAAAPASTGNGGAGLLGVIAFLLAAGALWLAWDVRARFEARTDHAPLLDALKREIGNLEVELARSGERQVATDAALVKLAGDPDGLHEQLGEQLHRIEAAERGLGEVRSLLATLRSDREQMEQMQVDATRLKQQIDEVRGSLAGLAGRVADLGKAAPAAAPGAAPAAPAADAGPKLDEATKKLIADLSSKDASVRWAAVNGLAGKHDPTLVSYLLPMLDDTDTFVQFRAIDAMKELSVKSSVNRLIKLLRDSDQLVRDEALNVLVTLTGNPLRFNATDGTPVEREKGVKAWEEWYTKNKERFEAPSSS